MDYERSHSFSKCMDDHISTYIYISVIQIRFIRSLHIHGLVSLRSPLFTSVNALKKPNYFLGDRHYDYGNLHFTLIFTQHSFVVLSRIGFGRVKAHEM